MQSFRVNWNLTLKLCKLSDQITTLNLDGQGIYKLTNLNGLVSLRWASFNDNDISKVEGLDSCLNLEELSLNNNNISTLSGESGSQRHSEIVSQPEES